MAEERNKELDRNLKIEETIDAKNEKIVSLERELARKEDEVNLRKDVIDSMSDSLMKHEAESRELASKLVMLKN
jgi:chromosome segregation ATPase